MIKPSLVIIDDQLEMGGFICEIADSLGFNSSHIQDGREFIQRPVNNEDIIVLDLLMPDIDGVEIIRFLAEQKSTSSLVLVSGVDTSVLHSAQELAEEHGLNISAALQKPFHPDELKTILRTLLKINQTQTITQSLKHEAIMVKDLQLAIESKQIVPYFQPQTSFSQGRLLGFEALARWIHPEKGIISPAQFIPLAEESGLIESLTWTLLQQIAVFWQHHQLTQSISINIPASLLKSLDLPEKIATIIREYSLDPSQLLIEITESEMMEEASKSLDSLTRLRMYGFRLSIDDFGTGYSSLVQLYRAPFTELKIDMSFVTKMENNPEALAIVEATILLAKKMKLQVVAEGVENEGIYNKLAALNVDTAQGYYIAKPIPKNQLMDWISTYNNSLLN